MANRSPVPTQASKSESPVKKASKASEGIQSYLKNKKTIQQRPYFNRLQLINLDQQVLGRSYF